MIEVSNLTKRYAGRTAVSDISFAVAPGEIVGLLGPNGAGKSTTMRILSCFMPATSGTARVAGFDVFHQSVEVRRRIKAGDRSQVPGLVRVSFGLYNNTAEVDALVKALKEIAAGRFKGHYHQTTSSGEFAPEGWNVRFEDYFSFDQDVIHL